MRRIDSASAVASQQRVLEPLGGASRSNSSSWASTTARDPAAGGGAAFAPGIPLDVAQVAILQGGQRQVLGAVPVAGVGGSVEVEISVSGGQLAAHGDGSGR